MYTKNPNIVLRCIHGSYFLIDITANYLEEKFDLYEINEIGAFLWNHMENECTIEGLIRKLIENIDGEVNTEEMEKDVVHFLETLKYKNFVNEDL